MFHPGTSRLIACWAGLAAGGVPARAQFDPLAVHDLLPQMFLLAREGDRLALRIAGENLRDLFARPLKGTDIFQLFAPTAQPLARRTALQAVRDGLPMVLVSTGRAKGGGQVPMEVVLAPLRGADGTTDRLIGMIQPTASLVLLDGEPVHEVTVRIAATAGTGPQRPGLRLVAIDGQRLA